MARSTGGPRKPAGPRPPAAPVAPRLGGALPPGGALRQEVERARRQLVSLTEEVARNTRILRQSQARELALLQAEDLPSLFREMLDGLALSYGLDSVTVVMCDPDHEVRHLLLGSGCSPARLPGLEFVDSLAGLAPQYAGLRSPWLGPYRRADHAALFPRQPAPASIAILPLVHNGTLFGSLNFGSGDRQRFTPAHATDFFGHLAVIAAFALENVINRARLMRSGFTDVLTGWHNRRYLTMRLAEELARARRDDASLVCLMLDLDHFKEVNDTWGHAVGDDLLREVAQRIEAQVRASDVAARYGGEEFVVLLPHTDQRAGIRLAERIRRAVCGEPVALEGGEEIDVTTSIGIAAIAPGRDDRDLKRLGESLLAEADAALYRAKSAGRNRIETFRPDGRLRPPGHM